MVAYNNLMQQDNESMSQYLIRAKVLLECINHTYKLSQISSRGLNNIALICRLRDIQIRWTVTKEEESWTTMEDLYRNINRITKINTCTKAYHESRYNSISEVMTEGINKVSYNKGKRQHSYDKCQNSSAFRKQYNSSPHNRYEGNSHLYQAQAKMKCYYCDGKHSINTCKEFKKDKDKYTLNRTDIAKK